MGINTKVHIINKKDFMKKLALISALAVSLVGCSSMKKQGTSEVILASEVNWEKLNPARGNKSPQAGTLWGDRKGNAVPTGFLVKFVDGFSSPPHIHNVTYRGVVISGLVHNDDPKAAPMWMPQGSYWTQPRGESHITSAKGKTNIAFIEIESAPYLVKPANKAFDSGERPLNIDASNIVWQKVRKNKNAKVSYLWGTPKSKSPSGLLLHLASGSDAKIISRGSILKSVVIAGSFKHGDKKNLTPGSYFGSTGKYVHNIKCESKNECKVYVRSDGKFKIK